MKLTMRMSHKRLFYLFASPVIMTPNEMYKKLRNFCRCQLTKQSIEIRYRGWAKTYRTYQD